MKRFLLILMVTFHCYFSNAQKGTLSHTVYYYENLLGVPTDKIESEGNMFYTPAQKGKLSTNIKVGLWKFYHPNGTLKANVEYKDGFETGYTIFFTETGLKATEGEFKLGMETGIWKGYYDGKLRSETEFLNGSKNGNYFEYSTQTGIRTLKGTYQNDNKVGRWVSFDANGIQNGEINYNQFGKKEGYWTYTDYSTQEITAGNYKEDERVGIWKVKNKEGKTIQTVDYDLGISTNFAVSGELLSELIFFKAPNNRIGLRHFLLQNENGKKKLEGDFDDRLTYLPEFVDQLVKPKGIWNSYWDDGELATAYNLNNGTFEVIKSKMEEKYFYANGKGAYGKGEKVLKELSFKIKEDTLRIEMKDLLGLNPMSNFPLTYIGPKLNLGSFTRTGLWENYDSSGNLETKVNYNYLTNTIIGPYTSYYKNGKVRSSGEYDDAGKRKGVWTFYYENGNKSEESSFDNGKRTGLVSGYFINGFIKQKGAYVEDKRVGIHEYFHPNGKLLGTENFKAGAFVSFGDFYTEEGSLSMQQGSGVLVKYYDNMNKLEIANYLNGKLNGNYISYFANGNKKFESIYQNGVLQGDYLFYFEAGGKMEKGTYINGKAESTLTQFHPNGNILGKSIYKNGVFLRPEVFFDEKGNSIMSNGTGTHLTYSINGKVNSKITFLDYCRNGKAQWFYDNGQLKEEVIYKYSDANKPIGLRWEIVSSFSPNGEKRNPGTLYEGNGSWISYDETGKSTTKYFKKGLPE